MVEGVIEITANNDVVAGGFAGGDMSQKISGESCPWVFIVTVGAVESEALLVPGCYTRGVGGVAIYLVDGVYCYWSLTSPAEGDESPTAHAVATSTIGFDSSHYVVKEDSGSASW